MQKRATEKRSAHSSSPSEKTMTRIIKGIISNSTHREAPKPSATWSDSRSNALIFKHRRDSHLHSTGTTLSSPFADALKGVLVEIKELDSGT